MVKQEQVKELSQRIAAIEDYLKIKEKKIFWCFAAYAGILKIKFKFTSSLRQTKICLVKTIIKFEIINFNANYHIICLKKIAALILKITKIKVQ